MTFLPSNLKLGISIVDEPVATTMALVASIVSVVPSRVLTVTVFGPVTRRLAVEELDAVALEERADAAGELLDDAVLPVLQLVRVDARVVDQKAEAGAALHLLEGVARRDDGLARHAAPVEAHAADFLLLDAEDLLLELSEADRAGIAAGSAADDDRVVGLVGHDVR